VSKPQWIRASQEDYERLADAHSVALREMEQLRAALAAAEARATKTEAILRAFIGNVEEMSIGEGIPAGLVVTDDGGRTFHAVQSHVTRHWYDAIMHKWRKDCADLVDLYDGYMHRALAAEAKLADERKHADELAACLELVGLRPDEPMRGARSRMLAAHAARRAAEVGK